MSALRSVSRLRHLSRHCSRLATTQQRSYADMSFTFASSSSVYYNHANVKQVDVPSFSGSFGILPEHVPLLAVLKPGVISVVEQDGAVNKFFVSSGSVTINEDSSVQILAEEAARLEELDKEAIKDGMSKASQEISSAQTDQAKAEAQVAAECFEALDKAFAA